MNLTLEVVNSRDPASGGVLRKVFGPRGGVIGRSPECDWVLTNPYVHRQHATVRCLDGIFYIESNGANGVALNNPQALIPRNQRRPLKNGDRLYIDEYEIAVNIAQAAEAVVQTPRIPPGQCDGGNSFERLPAPPDPRLVEPLEREDEDLKRWLEHPRPQEPAAPAHKIRWNDTPVEHHHVELPPIPDPQPAQDRPPARAVTPQIPEFNVEKLLETTPPGTQLPSAPPAAPQQPIRPVEVVPPKPVAEIAVVRPGAGRNGGGLPADLAALLRAAGIDPATVPAETVASFGLILRSMVQGLIELLHARAEVKDELRMSLTRVKTHENNPLKFAVNAEKALALLLGPPDPAFLPPVEAFEDAVNDLRFHQMAMVAGMRAAFEHVLDSFDPHRLQERFDKRGKPAGLLALGTKPRYWEQYVLNYEELTENRDTAFQRLFGMEFANAYEKQLEALKGNRARVRR